MPWRYHILTCKHFSDDDLCWSKYAEDLLKGKGKVKFNVEQAMKVNRALTLALEGGGWSTPPPRVDLPSGKRTATHCTGGWVGPSAGLDCYGKSRPHRYSIPGPSIQQRLAKKTNVCTFLCNSECQFFVVTFHSLSHLYPFRRQAKGKYDNYSSLQMT
jgi:hypothetical protein